MSSNWRSLSSETSSSLVLPIYRNGLLCLTHIFLPLSITLYFSLNFPTSLCPVVTRHISYGFFLPFSFTPLQLLLCNLYFLFSFQFTIYTLILFIISHPYHYIDLTQIRRYLYIIFKYPQILRLATIHIFTCINT